MPEFLNTHETFMNAFVCPYSVANETIFSSVVPLMFNHLPPECNVWINEKKKKKENGYRYQKEWLYRFLFLFSCIYARCFMQMDSNYSYNIVNWYILLRILLYKIIIRKSFANWSIISTATLCGTLLFSLLLAYKIPSILKNHSDNLAT